MKRGIFYPPGASILNDKIQIVFSTAGSTGADIKLVFFGKKGQVGELDISDSLSCGEFYSVLLDKNELPKGAWAYGVKQGEEFIRDICINQVVGWNHYGVEKPQPLGLLPSGTYDWGEDKSPHIPYEKSIIYGLHVRGFTKHPSSKVKARGTFRGIIEKLDYLNDLGITAIELMPCYEFDENIKPVHSTSETIVLEADSGDVTNRVNFWGFTDSGYYFAPKSAYSRDRDCAMEFKDMVKACHSHGIEVIMQFYFPTESSKGIIGDVLRFWALEYHVDGFRLLGGSLPHKSLLNDPLLKSTKLIWGDEATDDITWHYQRGDRGEGEMRHAALMSFGYTVDIRRFIKGDEDHLKALINALRKNDSNIGIINAITNHDGFTLRDLVSYNHKHNSANGEDGRDGSVDNYSWNCGEEGPCRKKSIKELRLKQSKNALALLFISQGTPYLRAGDEFGQTQSGNNNPYNQDNNTTYLNWKLVDREGDLLSFVKSLIALKKNHSTFSRRALLKDMDYKGLGAPDISYHGEELWKVNLTGHYRHVGILYNGSYAPDDEGRADDYFYAAINLHWDEHNFALPGLPEGLKWEMAVSTDGSIDLDSHTVRVSSRAIKLLRSVKDPLGKKDKKRGGVIKSAPKDSTSF